MDSFWIGLLGVIGGISIGWILREVAAIRAIAELEEMEREQDQSHHVLIEITEQNGIYYTFRADTKQFLVQGRSHEEIRELLSKYFPNETFIATNENIKSINLKLIDDPK